MKFSILLHKCHIDHYDFMLEQKNNLATWKISVENLTDLLDGKIIKSNRIQDHRKKYLNYEGLVSNNKGEVSIFDSGEFKEQLWNENEIIVSIPGNIISGEIFIKKTSPEEYIFQYIKD